MASDGGLIALTFLLLAALLALLYCLLRQIGATKRGLRRICACFLGPPFLSRTAASGLSGIGDDEDEEGDYIDSGGRRGGSSRGGGLFWKASSEEERSILGCRRVPGANSNSSANVAFPAAAALTRNNFHKDVFDSMNSYNSADYTYTQQEKMATAPASSAKLPPPVTNGISAPKNSVHAASSTAALEQQPMKAIPGLNVHATNIIASNSPDYTYAIRPPPKKEPPPSSATEPAIPASPQRASSPGPRRHRQEKKRSAEKSPLNAPVGPAAGVESSALIAINIPAGQQTAASGGSSRPMTPDFRYTVLADEDDDSRRKSAAAASSHDAGKMRATNGDTIRSASVDASSGGQLTTDSPAEHARRHSLTSVSASVVSPALAVDNPSPSGSVSDIDPESLLVLDESLSGACSRRTSISSVDSNFERLEDTSAPSLIRALSSDSLDSTCSIMDLSMCEPEIGQLETRLYYDSSNQYLNVWILQAYDIKPAAANISGGLVEYWVVVFLLPHQKPLYRTQLLPYAPLLQFHEQFRQRVRDQDLRKLALLCQLYCRTRPPHETQSVGAALAAAGAAPPLMSTSSSSSSLTPTKRSGTIAGSDLIGQAKVRLKDVELSVANTLWLSLLPRLDSASVDRNLGELLFSLSYLPTAERLTVVVAKARNIRTTDGVMPEKIMVRVYLVYGAKISKKKTSVKSAVEGSASFNESIIFSLSQNLVQKVYLRLSVVEPQTVKVTGEMRTIGHVTVGSRRTSKEFGHWQKMTEQPRKPVSMWHHLSPKTQKLA